METEPFRHIYFLPQLLQARCSVLNRQSLLRAVNRTSGRRFLSFITRRQFRSELLCSVSLEELVQTKTIEGPRGIGEGSFGSTIRHISRGRGLNNVPGRLCNLCRNQTQASQRKTTLVSRIEQLTAREDSLAEVRLQEGESIDNALRRFKRKVQTEHIIKEVKRHSFSLKPGAKVCKTSSGAKACSQKNQREQD